MKRNGFSIKTEREPGTNAKDIKLRGDPVLKYEHQVKTVAVSVLKEKDLVYFEDYVKYHLDNGYELVETKALNGRESIFILFALLIKRIVREDDLND